MKGGVSFEVEQGTNLKLKKKKSEKILIISHKNEALRLCLVLRKY